MLTKILNGAEVVCSADEEAAIRAEWAANDASPAFPPGTVAPKLIASAMSIDVSNSDVTGIAGAYNLVAAIYLDVGQFMLFFLAPQPDSNYFAMVNGSAPNFSVTEQTEDYLIVQATDGVNGSPCDPSRFNVQIYRMES